MITIYNIIEMLNGGNADYSINEVLEDEPIIDCEENGGYIFIKSKHYIIQIKIQK